MFNEIFVVLCETLPCKRAVYILISFWQYDIFCPWHIRKTRRTLEDVPLCQGLGWPWVALCTGVVSTQLASIPYNTWLWHGFWWENMVPVGNYKSISIQFAGQCSWGILIAPVAILWGDRQCWRCFKSTNATMNATVSTSRVCGQTGPKSQTCSSSKCYYIVLNRFGCWRQCSNRLMIQPISVIYSDQEWCNQH